jgi:DNA invertase Pin-like site-specific DNA recombinase
VQRGVICGGCGTPSFGRSRAGGRVAELGDEIDNFVMHVFAAVAERERELISRRTLKAA